jgi:mono/diheme cytochrome c family protein
VEPATISLEKRKIKYLYIISFIFLIYTEQSLSNENGKILSYAAGCYGCHTSDPEKPFGGGYKIKTKYGTFITPNITKDITSGIGKWSKTEFIQAIKHGISPSKKPYYPAFPYSWYSNMQDSDILDIFDYLNSIPSIQKINSSHDLKFPYRIRETLWLWRIINRSLQKKENVSLDVSYKNRGEYLIKSVVHCSACHSPRTWFSIIKDHENLNGKIETRKLLNDGAPNISKDKIEGIGSWSESDIVFFLQTGIKPNGDFSGKEMSKIIENGTSYLIKEDLEKISKYLLSNKNK